MFYFNGRPTAELVSTLETEGFDVCERMHPRQSEMQHGLVIGPKGLDQTRLKPGDFGVFIPTWELNQNTGLVLQRKFHDIVERRGPNWTPFLNRSLLAAS